MYAYCMGCLGVNGKIWVNAETPRNVIIVSNAIVNSEFMTRTEASNMVKEILRTFDRKQ